MSKRPKKHVINCISRGTPSPQRSKRFPKMGSNKKSEERNVRTHIIKVSPAHEHHRLRWLRAAIICSRLLSKEGSNMPNRIHHFLTRAANCREIAARARSDASRELFEHFARTWTLLAKDI